MLSIFRKIQSKDNDVNRLQDQIIQALNPLVRSTLLNYVELKDIVITAAGLDIEHTLGRQPLGWLVTDINANATVWKTAWTPKLLSLDASGIVTISLLIY